MSDTVMATGEEHKVKQPDLSVNLPSIDRGHLAPSVCQGVWTWPSIDLEKSVQFKCCQSVTTMHPGIVSNHMVSGVWV